MVPCLDVISSSFAAQCHKKAPALGGIRRGQLCREHGHTERGQMTRPVMYSLAWDRVGRKKKQAPPVRARLAFRVGGPYGGSNENARPMYQQVVLDAIPCESKGQK